MKGLGSVPIILGCIILSEAGWSQPAVPPATAAKQRPALPVGVQADWWSLAQAGIQQEEYAITWQERTALPDLKAAYQAPNRAQGFRTWFTEEGIRVVPRDSEKAQWEWGLALAGAEAGSWKPEAGEKQKPEIRVSENRIELDRGWITEWYVNSPEGLEQGFTIHEPPGRNVAQALLPAISGAQTGESALHLDLRLSGNLQPRFADDGQAVDFYDNGNVNIIHYAKLKVTDATGRILPSRFEGWAGVLNSELRTPNRGGGVRIVADAAGAAYPITIDPLATTPAWTAEGNQGGALFGISVGTAGDVNGDGYSDAIVGACYYDNGQTDEGRAFVYLGSASGLSGTAVWTAEGDQATAYFGNAVGTAGDVNGDGYSDIIVGAPNCDNGQMDEGRAFVYLGSASGPAAMASWTAESDQAGALFGTIVAAAGDVNNDGFSDVIVGAHNFDNDQVNEGRAFVYHGSASGLADTPAWTAESHQTNSRFAMTAGTAGDVNGDGFADVIVGAMYFSGGASMSGRAFVYHGSSAGLHAAADWTAQVSQSQAYFGFSVGTAGDVNGDGFADVVVGAINYDNGHTDEGRAFVYLGSASGLAGTAGWTAEVDQPSAYFGYSVATAGDVNGDGYADVLVGATGYDNDQSDEGRAYLYWGGPAGLAASAGWTAESDQSGSSFGCAVATAGDVNGDGYSDVIVGARDYDNGETNEGWVQVYHGSPSGLAAAAGWTAEADQASAGFGTSLASAGDVNGDGYADVIVGAPGFDGGEADEGRAWVFFGAPSGLGTLADWTAESDQASAQFGTSVASAWDVNGDGYAEIIVGAAGYDGGQTDEGRAYLYLGGPAGPAASAGWTAEGDQDSSYFGGAVASAGDVNGDGYSDVIVGAQYYDNGQNNEGRAFLYLGSASGLAASAAWTAESDQAFAYFGACVGTAGDVNGDGYSDVMVGAPYYDNGQTDEGRAFVFHGSATGLSAVAAWTAESDQAPDARFGHSAGTAGDVNGDGYSDVIVGAYGYDNGQSDEGRAYVFYGSPSGLGAAPAWTAESDLTATAFGQSVATAGDVNGDGYADVVVGALSYDNGQTDEGRAYVYHGSAAGLGPSPAWTVESDQAYAYFGAVVASAGDVNGDGYADVIAGAYGYDGPESNEGRTYLYYGNGGPGLSLTPQQRRADDAAPIAHLGRSDGGHMFEAALKGRTPYGTGKFRVEWEVKPLGSLFDGVGTTTSTAWQNTGLEGLLQKEILGGLAIDTPYHWRARLHYNPVTTPFQQASRWLTVPWSGWQEADLRTAYGAADLGITQTDTPDPLLTGGGNITYALTVASAGPDPAEVTLTDTLPAGSAFVSALPSQGSCGQAGGVVTCALGTINGGGSATVAIVVTPPGVGTCVNHAAVASPAGDDNPANNISDETTAVNAPSIGNFVWSDADGDGLQDPGEPGLAGIVVQLYDASFTWLAQKVTNPAGAYQFTGLAYGQGYFIKVFAPSSEYAFSQPDRGSDDTLDSDVDIATGQSPIFNLVNGLDPVRWDAGLVHGIGCTSPDERVWLYAIGKSVPDDYPILNFQDPNQTNQRTGWNIRRSSDPGLPKPDWPVIGSNVVDMDAGTPNYQYTDITGASGTWYYQVTAYNAYCPAEGPF